MTKPASTPLAIQRGIEREALRIDNKGQIAQTPHPKGLGRALTHSFITTDFSENLIEFVTTPMPNVENLLNQLTTIQKFSYDHMSDELFWPMSIPPFVEDARAIPIAEYGTSNSAKMRHLYRVGLSHRYGRLMQIIAGIHYNFSAANISSDQYMGLIRRFHCDSWLLPYLFGASPIVPKSLVKNKPDYLVELDKHHFYAPFGTSLRMSELGYQNDSQANLNINYNNVRDYAKTLLDATHTPYPAFQHIPQDQQLNDCVIQIENEYYNTIRPKQPHRRGERPANALCQRGVQYIEIRLLDLNPWNPLGIDLDTIYFMDVFLMYCLKKGCDPLCYKSCKTLRNNFVNVATHGRDPHLTINHQPFQTAALTLFEQLESTADKMGELFVKAVAKQKPKIFDPELTSSAKLLQATQHENYVNYCLSLAEKHRDALQNISYDAKTLAALKAATIQSETTWQQLEAEKGVSFDTYVKNYFSTPT